MIDEENERKEEENQPSYQGSSFESPQKSNKKPILIIVAILAVCCVGVLIFAFVTGGITIGDETYSLFNSNGQFDENLVNAYNSQGNISDEIFEMENIDYESSSSLSNAVKDVESFQKDNDKSKKHLDTALTQTNNDTEKQYVNLLLEQNKLLDRYLKLWINFLKDAKKYNDGKMDATQSSNLITDYSSKFSDLQEQRVKNLEEIRDLLGDNPGLEERLKSMGIKNHFIGDDGDS